MTAPGGVTVIEPRLGWRAVNLRELWEYRELLYFLTLRDVQVRYKQTVLGIGWAILQPLLVMLIASAVFGRMAGLGRELPGGIAYPVFVYTGLLAWTFFANAATTAGNSVVNSQNLVSKIYFPRLLIPAAAVGAGLVDLAAASGVLFGLMAWYGLFPGPRLLLLPLAVLLLIGTSLAVGTLLAGLTVTYRDFRYIVGFLTQIWLFATPVLYPWSLIASPYRWLAALNPMAGVVESFRFCLLGSHWPLDPVPVVVSSVVGSVGLFLAVHVFRRLERRFADVV